MTVQIEKEATVTLNIPGSVYASFKRKAEQSQRSVEAEILEVVLAQQPATHADPTPAKIDQVEGLAPELAAELAAMVNYSDVALRKAARSQLPATAVNRLEAINYKHQKVGNVTPDEERERQELLQQVDRYMLIRAQSAALLKQRGYDVSTLLKYKRK